MADNEIQIIVTAVDNATKEIDKVTNSITGTQKAADNSSQPIGKLSTAMQLLSRVSPEASRALGMVSNSSRLLGVNSLAGAGGVTALATAVIATLAAAKKAADDWSREVTTKWVENTEEDVRVAREYQKNMEQVAFGFSSIAKNVGKAWAEFTNFTVNSQKGMVGYGALGPKIPIELTPKITQEDFDKLVEQGVKAAEQAAQTALENSQKYQNNWYKSLFTNAINFQQMMDKAAELEKTYKDIKAAGPQKGDIQGYVTATETAKKNWQDSLDAIVEQKNQLIAMKLIEYFGSKESPGGIAYTPEEQAAIGGFLTETGLAANAAIQAAWSVNQTAAEIINGVIDTTNKNADALKTKMDGLTEPRTAQVMIEAKASGDTAVLEWIIKQTGGGSHGGSTTTTWNPLAGGGDFSGWAMVGDAAGGKITPYTEWVYAPFGARVYNQSQIGNMQAPPMASGGTIKASESIIDYDKLALIVRDAVLLR